VASIHIINDLRRSYEMPSQQEAYQPSGNGTSGQGAWLSLATGSGG
jgi:hypothetical protein